MTERISEIIAARPGIDDRTFCSASRELHHSTTDSPKAIHRNMTERHGSGSQHMIKILHVI